MRGLVVVLTAIALPPGKAEITGPAPEQIETRRLKQNEEIVVSKDQTVGKSEDHVNQNSEGIKRRDLLLSGSSLVAASALMGAGVATPAHAQLPARTPPSGQRPNIVVIMGDDIGWSNIGAYHQGVMYIDDAESRQAGGRGHALHRLLRGAELHRRPSQLHHGRIADLNWFDHGWPSRCHGRDTG